MTTKRLQLLPERMAIAARGFAFWLLFQSLVLGGLAVYVPIPPELRGLVIGTMLLGIMVLATWLFLKTEISELADLRLIPRFPSVYRFLLGFFAGLVLFGSFFLVYLWMAPVNFVDIKQPNLFYAVVISFLTFLVLSAMEEVVFRGYFLHKLIQAAGPRLAIYTTSLAFGLYHGPTIESLIGPTVWGLIYAVLALSTRGLAVPIGFHAGVNYLQALFSQKHEWVPGIWTVEVYEGTATLSVEQVTMLLQLLLFIAAIILVEVYLRKESSAHHSKHRELFYE